MNKQELNETDAAALFLCETIASLREDLQIAQHALEHLNGRVVKIEDHKASVEDLCAYFRSEFDKIQIGLEEEAAQPFIWFQKKYRAIKNFFFSFTKKYEVLVKSETHFF